MNLPFVIIHFNTPELTTCLCSSIRKFHPNNEIIIFDNSTTRKFPNENVNLFNITYMDNTDNQILNFDYAFRKFKKDDKIVKQNNLGSAKHCFTVDFLIKILDKNFILLDSDVLLKKPIDFINESLITVGLNSKCEQNKNKTRKIRFLPYLQYFNVDKIKELNLNYFNPNEICGLTINSLYDTGASFYKLIKSRFNKNEFNENINIFNYIVHFGAASYQKKEWYKFLMRNKRLWT